MSNTDRLRRTEAVPLDGPTLRQISTVLATVLLAIVLISFRPFQPEGPASQGGDIVNQIGFGSLALLAGFSLLTLSDRRVVAIMVSPWWLIVFGFLALSVFHAIDPPSAGRAALFTAIGVLAVVTILVLPRDADSFTTVLLVAGLAAVLLSYAGLVLFPATAVHLGEGVEPQHAGLWRGAFSHKNVAGPVMACLSFAGLYAFRRGRRRAGGTLLVLAMVFMANTGSKTTAGLVPLSIVLVALPGILGMRFLTPLIFLGTMIGATLATLGIVFIEPLKELAQHVAPNLTYTGRTALWDFLGGMIAQKPWFGFGYESFWGTPFIYYMDQPFDRAWDIRGSVHGHNGYLDIAVIMGLPALAACLVAFWIVPLFDYMRTPRLKENIYLSDFFMMILLFTSLNAFLESFFLRRVDPVWLFFLMGCLGLRMAARIRIPSSSLD
ncbi:O-antigen ligase family protein [Nitratireductor sp. CAU 1489]|uniref:O-antigen ligase family protein n=1 Tax=Nitratireductor arenosus TaxID=2682096 RepID=A0A844QNQ6_9HYPH|nr:O-antigen ligase [Nitratireductor arenosus]MVA99688.1 O-antigen ligase family protein [Nitratireductor arenosus]